MTNKELDLDNPQIKNHVDKYTAMLNANHESMIRAKVMNDAVVLNAVLGRVSLQSRFLDAKTLKDSASGFIQQELTRVDAVAIKAKTPQFTTREIWNVRNVGAGFRTLRQPFYERTGEAAWFGDNQTDAKENAGKVGAAKSSDDMAVRKLFSFYDIDLMEMESMIVAGEQLDEQKGVALREAIEAKLNTTVWFGYKAGGVKGFFNHAKDGNFNAVTRTAGTWLANTAEQIYADIEALSSAAFDNTNALIDTKILVVPANRYKRILHARFSDATAESVYARLISNNIITKLVYAPELNIVTSAQSQGLTTNKAVAVMTSDDNMVNRIEHPLEFTTLPILDMQTHIRVFAHANTSGFHVYQQKSSSYMLDV